MKVVISVSSSEPDAFGTPPPPPASPPDSEILISHLSNKLTISETETESETPLSSRSAHDESPTTEPAPVDGSFDVCPPKSSSNVVLKPPLLFKNRERRRQRNTPSGIQLRPGMVLLKSFLSLTDQVPTSLAILSFFIQL